MSNKKIAEWVELSRKQIFSKYGRKVDEVIFRLPDGQEKDFIIKNEGPAAGILAITKDNQVILARQFRPGVKEILDELPGGYVDPTDKSPEIAAQRELLEETGYSGDIELVGVAYDDAYSTMKRYCFVARNCTFVQTPQTESTEDIEVITIPLDKFRAQLLGGKMTDVEVGYMGLDYLGLL